MTKASREKLINQVAYIMHTLGKLAVEIDELRKTNQKVQAKNKIKELKKLFGEYLGADAAEVRLAEATINQDSDFFKDYLISALVSKLDDTEYFDEIEDDMVTASFPLREEPYDLLDEDATIAQKFGFLIALFKKINIQERVIGCTKSLTDFLTKNLEIRESKLKDITHQIELQGNKLVEKYFKQLMCILYVDKISSELKVNEANDKEPEAVDIGERMKDKNASLGQLLKHAEKIDYIKGNGSKDLGKLEQEWGKFNKILEQAFNASAKEIHEIGLALDEGMEKFKEVFGPFMIDKIEEEFPFENL